MAQLKDLVEKEVEALRRHVSFENIGIVAESDKSHFRMNSSHRGSSASLIKAFYAAALYQHFLMQGGLPENTQIDVNPSLAAGSPSSLVAGDSVPLSRLLEEMVHTSCSFAANLIIGCLGHDFINKFLEDSGFANTSSRALFRRHPDFGPGNIIDGEYAANCTSAGDVCDLLKMVFTDKLYPQDSPNYFTLNPHHRMRQLLEHHSNIQGFPHPLAGYLQDGKFIYELPLENVAIGQKFGIQFYDFGVCGYVYPIRENGTRYVYFISILINGMREPLKDAFGRATPALQRINRFVSSLSRKVYDRFIGNQL